MADACNSGKSPDNILETDKTDPNYHLASSTNKTNLAGTDQSSSGDAHGTHIDSTKNSDDTDLTGQNKANSASATSQAHNTNELRLTDDKHGDQQVLERQMQARDGTKPSESNDDGGMNMETDNVSSPHSTSNEQKPTNKLSLDQFKSLLADPRTTYHPDEPDLIELALDFATKKELVNRLLGCAYGQALGDAYGLSTEFETRHEVAYNYPDESKIIPFPDYVLTGHSRRWTQGDWTDDTDQWILILETLTREDKNEPEEVVFAKKLTSWIRHGFRELGDWGGLGLGANVSQVVHSQNYLIDPLRASRDVWERGNRQAAPNGAVMRCSATAFVHFDDKKKVISTTETICKTTHYDPRCIASCLAVCLTITYILNDDFDNNNIESLVERVKNETIALLGETLADDQRHLFEWHIDKNRTLEELDLDEARAIGYTYKCLASGFYGLRSTRAFKNTLNDLIRFGGDADTNGAVCGTMYGTRHGYRALPYEWLRLMPNKRWFDRKLIECLIQMNLIQLN